MIGRIKALLKPATDTFDTVMLLSTLPTFVASIFFQDWVPVLFPLALTAVVVGCVRNLHFKRDKNMVGGFGYFAMLLLLLYYTVIS